MNIEFFIAKRLVADKTNRKSISQTIIRIAEGGISLSITVMILAVAIVIGFKKEITDKVIGFGSHIQITNQDTNESYEATPISKEQSFVPIVENLPNVKKIQPFGIKAGLIKTETDNQGVVLKGIGADYDWSFFRKYLIEGQIIDLNDSAKTNGVLISEYIAKLMKLNVGDKMTMYFIRTQKGNSSQYPRVRSFKIAGIYNTGLETYDKTVVLGDIKHVQKLNNWKTDQVTGLEILLADFERLDETTSEVWYIAGSDFLEDGTRLSVENIRDLKPEIFTWLGLTDVNLWVVLILMFLVAGANMISALLVLILERTQMIGIVKSLGMNNFSVRKVFLISAAFLTLKGLFWGNVIGLGFAFVQEYFGLIPLDPSSYYVDSVPVHLVWWHVLLLNLGTVAVIVLIMLIPSMVIAKISPVKAIRFE